MANIFELSEHISSERNVIEFLRIHGVLKRNHSCCGNLCSKVMDVSLTDKEIFQCNSCHRRYSIRTNSYFAKSKLKLTVLLSILYFFANSCSVTNCVSFMKGQASKVSIIQWFNFYHDVMTTWLSNNPVQFDGRVNVIHVDETAVGGKHKYHRGRNVVRPHWLFGITQKDSHKIHLQFIPNREKIMILPIIYRHVRQGSEINSDGAKCYKSLIHMGYTHNVVIHKYEFVTDEGIHTNNIENVWSNLKSVLKKI